MTIVLLGFTIFRMGLEKDYNVKNYEFLIIYGVLIMYAFLSRKWSVGYEYTVGYVKSMILLFFNAFSLIKFVDNREKLNKVLKIYIIFLIYMCFNLIFFEKNTPGTALYGEAVGLYFNSIAHMLAIGCFISYYIFKKEKKYIYLIFVALFFYVIFLTGSRKGILFPFVTIAGIELLDKRLSIKKILKIFVVASIGIILIVVLLNSNQKIKYRLSNMFLSFFGESVEDKSLNERKFFREQAKWLFENNPIIRSWSWWIRGLYGKNKLFSCCILS